MLGNRLYIATSSSGGGVARQIFRGSMIALDIRTGKIVWQTFVLPDNGGEPGGFAGGAFVNPPAIDVENGLVYGAAGQLYFQPESVTACLAAAPDGWDEKCFPAGAYFNSVIAFDLRTGKPRWSFRGAGPSAAARLRQGAAGLVCTVAELQHLGLCRLRRERVSRAHPGTLARPGRDRPEERRVLDVRCTQRKAAVEPARRPRRRSRRHPVGHRG